MKLPLILKKLFRLALQCLTAIACRERPLTLEAIWHYRKRYRVGELSNRYRIVQQRFTATQCARIYSSARSIFVLASWPLNEHVFLLYQRVAIIFTDYSVRANPLAI